MAYGQEIAGLKSQTRSTVSIVLATIQVMLSVHTSYISILMREDTILFCGQGWAILEYVNISSCHVMVPLDQQFSFKSIAIFVQQKLGFQYILVFQTCFIN